MGRWLERAKGLETRLGVGDNRDDRDIMADQGSFVPNVPIVPALSPRDLLISWQAGVASLDVDRPLGGYARDRWVRIVHDCDTLIADFGKGAAMMGWSTDDLFGFPAAGATSDGLGGLIWRLDGGRILFMDEVGAAYRLPLSDRSSRFARDYIGRMPGALAAVWELPE